MIKIITDSSSLFSQEQALEKGFNSLPLHVVADQNSYRDYEEIDSKNFTELTKDAVKLSTSQPSVGEKMELYNEILKNPDDQILDITITDKMSGTHQSALMAKESCDDPSRVTVFDSTTLCGTHQHMVLKALEMRDAGCTLDQIVDALTKATKHVASGVCVLDLNHVVRGGRLPKSAAVAGNLLKVMPLAVIGDEGTLKVHGVARTWKKVFESLDRFLESKGMTENWTLYITHANNPQVAQKAKDWYQAKYPNMNIVVQVLDAMFMVHGGEGCMAFQAIEM